MAPVRSCITCRKKGTKGELLKLADTQMGVVADYGERLPGRGAYTCFELSCIRGALEPRALSRAFRKKVAPPGLDALITALWQAVDRRVSSLMGMARKSRNIVWGFDAVLAEIGKKPGGLLVLAGDISGNTLGKLRDKEPEAFGRAFPYSTREGLGRLLGTDPVAVVYVSDPGLSAAIRLELGRLNAINRG